MGEFNMFLAVVAFSLGGFLRYEKIPILDYLCFAFAWGCWTDYVLWSLTK